MTVTAAARERLAALLGELSAPGSFSAQRSAPVDELSIEVRGLGQLVLPVPEVRAKELSRLGRPARYGRGTQTLLDRRVRDTCEIPRSRVKIDGRRWNKTLRPLLEELRKDLGLPERCRLTAELHSLLVYGPGQFFAPHQDSEKADAMVGSLVVTLPSSFTGGALVVEHGGETRTYRSSKKSLSLVAFYADCRHQIRPVRSGYRIVLTYNLLAQADTTPALPPQAPPGAVDALARCAEEHFTTPPPPRRFVDTPPAPPRRLVYLLDHEYTARGLSWSRLKGSDARQAAVLREAAEHAGCDIVLALADIHETWSCYEPDWRRSRYARGRSHRWGHHDDEFDEDDVGMHEEHSSEFDEYELEELVDWGISLDCWLDPSGAQAEPVATSVGDHEVCAATPTVNLRPYASEYEGYMGNYGNTMDRWYRRGALVLWPRDHAFAVHAEASPTWALDSLSAILRTAGVAEARTMAGMLAPFWRTVVAADANKSLLAKALRVARALDEPAMAAMLVDPFRLEMVAPGHARALAELVERYGDGWVRDRMVSWWGLDRWRSASGKDRLTWIASLGRLCTALDAAGEPGTSAARLFTADSWAWLRRAVEERRGLMPPSSRDRALAELARPILALLVSTAVIAASDLRNEAVGFLCEEDDVLVGVLPLLRAGQALSPEARRAAGLDTIANHCARRLKARLARPRRSEDDWSIDVPGGCSCELCETIGGIGGFLADPTRRSFEWPLAKDSRRHVHGMLDRAELPVVHQTRRAGRPFTLVLTKTEELFNRERKTRRRDEADLAWLDGEWFARC